MVNYKDNFAGLEEEFSSRDNSQIAVVSIPFDETVSWLSGTKNGPAALIEASANMELYDIETGTEVYKKGIYTEKPVRSNGSEEMLQKSHDLIKEILAEGKLVVTLGGEHSISAAPIKAHADYYKNISVLQLDAHTDLRPAYEGNKYSHASIMARVNEMENVKDTLAVGIRAMDSSELPFLNRERVYFAEDIVHSDDWMDQAIEKLSENVYLTFDIDVLDPSIMSSTGTPEPGGMQWYQTLKFIKKVAEKRKLIGFDVVELLPVPHFRAPDFLAAKLVYKILTYIFVNR